MQNINLITLLGAAVIFGLSNGLNPGPTLTLVISHTLQHNFKAGVKVACGPIIFGITIVPIIIFFSIQINNFKILIGLISLIGAIYIARQGIKLLLSHKAKLDITSKKSKSLRAGVFANFSSPYAYIFWFTVGAPLIVRSEGSNLWGAISFVGIYYFCLIGSKILVALIVEKFRLFIEKGFNYVMFFLGIMLLLFAFLTFIDAFSFFKQ